MERQNVKEKKLVPPKKKWSGDIFFFLIKNFNHGKIEEANPSSIKLICCGLKQLWFSGINCKPTVDSKRVKDQCIFNVIQLHTLSSIKQQNV